MAKCRRCARSGWTIRTDSTGLCRTCGTTIQADVQGTLARVKASLVYLRCARTPDSILEICDASLKALSPLLDYERRGLVSVTPKPSALVAMLTAKRNEALAEGTFPSPAEPAAQEAPATPAPREPLATEAEPKAGPKAAPAPSTDGSDWWAWDLEEEDLDIALDGITEADETSRKSVRKNVRCFVVLEPGGIRATLENVSTGGLFLQAQRLRPTGSRVRVILSTAEGPLPAEGVVRWVRKGNGTLETSGMGIEFTRQSPELRAFLEKLFPEECPAVKRRPRQHLHPAP